MSFDRIEHTGLLHKIKFYCVYDKMFFLIGSFLSGRKLWVSWNYKSYSKCIINSGIRQTSILIHLFDPTYLKMFWCSLMMFCAIWVVISAIIVTVNHLTCHNKLRYPMSSNLILKIWECNTRNIKNGNSAPNYVLIFGKLFFVYQLIHIDLKPRILIASFILAPLLND